MNIFHLLHLYIIPIVISVSIWTSFAVFSHHTNVAWNVFNRSRLCPVHKSRNVSKQNNTRHKPHQEQSMNSGWAPGNDFLSKEETVLARNYWDTATTKVNRKQTFTKHVNQTAGRGDDNLKIKSQRSVRSHSILQEDTKLMAQQLSRYVPSCFVTVGNGAVTQSSNDACKNGY